MPSIETSKPHLYGEVDQSIVSILRETALTKTPPQFSDRWSANKRSSKKGLKHHAALGPLLEIVLDCAEQSGYSPREVNFDIDAHDVHPASAQRMSGKWHIDGWRDGLRSRLVIADCLPTQVLVSTPDTHIDSATIDYQELEEMKRAKHFPPDPELGLIGLEIYTPPPRRLVEIGNRLHRSPLNLTGGTIQRTFIRANLIE